MTGNEMIKAIKKHKGKVLVPMIVPEDTFHVVAEKQNLKEYFAKFGDEPCGMTFEVRSHGYAYIDAQ